MPWIWVLPKNQLFVTAGSLTFQPPGVVHILHQMVRMGWRWKKIILNYEPKQDGCDPHDNFPKSEIYQLKVRPHIKWDRVLSVGHWCFDDTCEPSNQSLNAAYNCHSVGNCNAQRSLTCHKNHFSLLCALKVTTQSIRSLK